MAIVNFCDRFSVESVGVLTNVSLFLSLLVNQLKRSTFIASDTFSVATFENPTILR